jgi:hypothetical protein
MLYEYKHATMRDDGRVLLGAPGLVPSVDYEYKNVNNLNMFLHSVTLNNNSRSVSSALNISKHSLSTQISNNPCESVCRARFVCSRNGRKSVTANIVGTRFEGIGESLS